MNRLVLVLCLLIARVSSGQELESASPDAGTAPPTTLAAAPSSPRVSMATFLQLTRAGRYEEAASYLELPRGSDRGAELARQLRVVLDRNLWVDLDQLSGLPGGKADDELPPGTDELGRLPGRDGEPVPVRIVQRTRGGEPRWVFTSETVANIVPWYASVDGRWLHEHLPPILLRPGPKALMWWQWLALPLLCLLAWGAGKVLSRLTEFVLGRLSSRTETRWDDTLLHHMREPFTFGWALITLGASLSLLSLNPAGGAFLAQATRVGLFIAFFWVLIRLVHTGGQFIVQSGWSRLNPASRSLVPLAARVTKVAVFAVAVVAVVSEMGYPVASLVAGLGIGGLAVALAAQKTVENLFGAFSLGVDQPFREGDFVKVEDFVGNVETIGLRSTRIRTLDRTLITLPNGKLAEMRIESYAERDRMRLACIVGLVYGTTAEQMRTVLAGLERTLRAHPRLWQEALTVRFQKFGESSLDIEVMAWFQTQDWAEFQGMRQDILIEFMDVVEKAGTSFAFPTRTVHLANRTAS